MSVQKSLLKEIIMYLCGFSHPYFSVTCTLCSGLLWCDSTFSCTAFSIGYGNTNYFKSTFIQIEWKKLRKNTRKGGKKILQFWGIQTYNLLAKYGKSQIKRLNTR